MFILRREIHDMNGIHRTASKVFNNKDAFYNCMETLNDTPDRGWHNTLKSTVFGNTIVLEEIMGDKIKEQSDAIYIEELSKARTTMKNFPQKRLLAAFINDHVVSFDGLKNRVEVAKSNDREILEAMIALHKDDSDDTDNEELLKVMKVLHKHKDKVKRKNKSETFTEAVTVYFRCQ
ncbi:hypothetical protein BDF20DRAFT_927459 [Mycotypha africana]|uniref:uncharacterized protein n=1 Tax=Mycotypha africana TaxID=64632 RepID=UPI0023005E91|nr:uncharacterized protein BDF20DRAFT_927459 [Mycotypha africana]KAI8967745.1 hypothetical protein BDF20DRAFT_927459 [Mycotypha africana]